MRVIKRSGRIEDVKFDKVTKPLTFTLILHIKSADTHYYVHSIT